jgi:hypothetical protein
MKTWSPIDTEWFISPDAVALITAFSQIIEHSPISISDPSESITAPYITLDFGPIFTLPTTVAFGATKTDEAT